MSKRFAEMSVQEFCNYVAANPGGAAKAYELRKKYGGDVGEGGERIVYQDRVVEKVVEVPVYQDRVVEVVKEVVVYQDHYEEPYAHLDLLSEKKKEEVPVWKKALKSVGTGLKAIATTERIHPVVKLGAVVLVIAMFAPERGAEPTQVVVQETPEVSEVFTPMLRQPPKSDCEIWRDAHPQIAATLEPGDRCFAF